LFPGSKLQTEPRESDAEKTGLVPTEKFVRRKLSREVPVVEVGEGKVKIESYGKWNGECFSVMG